MKTALPKKILVVDDDNDLRAGLMAVLSRRGYTTLEADDGRAARDIITNDRPDLVILDMMMPRWGGFAVLEHFQNAEHKPQFIMISANGGLKHRAYAEEVGVVDFLVKPFSIDRLLEGVTKTLGAEETAQAEVSTETPGIRCRCHSCGARIKAPRHYYGQTRPCPGCMKPFTVTPAAPEDEGVRIIFDDHVRN